MKKRVKKECLGQILSNGSVKEFNTNDITEAMIPFYEKKGFAHIFEEVIVKKKVVKKTKPEKEEDNIKKAQREVKEYSKNEVDTSNKKKK